MCKETVTRRFYCAFRCRKSIASLCQNLRGMTTLTRTAVLLCVVLAISACTKDEDCPAATVVNASGPRISQVLPYTQTAGWPILIRGENFHADTRVFIGQHEIDSIVVLESGFLTGTVPVDFFNFPDHFETIKVTNSKGSATFDYLVVQEAPSGFAFCNSSSGLVLADTLEDTDVVVINNQGWSNVCDGGHKIFLTPPFDPDGPDISGQFDNVTESYLGTDPNMAICGNSTGIGFWSGPTVYFTLNRQNGLQYDFIGEMARDPRDTIAPYEKMIFCTELSTGQQITLYDPN